MVKLNHYKILIIYINEGHSGGINAVYFSHDDRIIISGGDDKLIKIWDSDTFKLLNSFEGIINLILLYLKFY